MLINQNIQTKYLLLNTNDKIDTTRWNIPTNYNFSQKIKMALVSINNATDNNLNMVFCPTIKDNHFSSLNTHPLIYSGIGYNNQNIINGKQYYDVNGAYFNEIELKTFSCPPQNNFSYPELDGLRPNLWLKFDTGAITTDYGTDNIYVYNINATPNGGVSVRGNDSVNFNGTNHYLTGTINNTNNNFWSVSFWLNNNYSGAGAVFFSMGSGGTAYTTVSFQKTNNKYGWSDLNTGPTTVNTFSQDLNNWVHLVFIYNQNTERIIYRNGIKEELTSPIIPNQPLNINTTFTIGKMARTTGLQYYYPGYMDDLRVYTGTVLTQDQINAIYNNTRINYPIIKNESYKLPHPTDNELNIDLSPVLWYKFDDSTNLGLDTMGKLNLGANGANPLPTYETIATRGSGSAKFIATQTFRSSYNYSDFINEITICFWLKISGLTGSGDTIISNTADGNKLLIQRNVLTSNFSLRLFNSGSLTTHFVGQYIADNTWKHYTITIKNLSGVVEVKSYLNGVLNATTTTGTWSTTNLTSLALGNATASLLGNLDDVRFYNKVLTQEEITRIYNGDKIDNTILTIEPLIGQDLSPVIWYKFDDSTNIGLDTMGKVNLVQNFANPLMTYDTTTVRGSGSIKGIAGQSMLATYNFSDIIDEFSICFWMRITTLNTNWDNIIYSINLQSKFLISRNGATSNFYITLFGSGTLGAQTHLVGGYVADNIWKHYTITTQKTSTGAVRTTSYLNGVLNNTYTAGTWDKSGILTYGLSSGTSTLGFIGNLDDLRMYNRVLSQAQITEIYAGNTFYNLPTALTRYNTEPTNTTYQFEVVDEEQKLIK